MYRVVLIDDERIIVEGLRRVVKLAEYHCEVIGTAYDAVSGAAMIRSARPDIVFTDIRMPDQDGLTMLAGLKSEFPDMQIAVLTGYRDFPYAQEAIRLGVCRYLLKPSKMDELHEALAREHPKRLPLKGEPFRAGGIGEIPQFRRSGAGFLFALLLLYISASVW